MSSPYNRVAAFAPSDYVADPTLIHERPSESIQGGSAGEHYHLTADEHTSVLALIAASATATHWEPVMAGGEIVIDGMGDLIMQEVPNAP